MLPVCIPALPFQLVSMPSMCNFYRLVNLTVVTRSSDVGECYIGKVRTLVETAQDQEHVCIIQGI